MSGSALSSPSSEPDRTETDQPIRKDAQLREEEDKANLHAKLTRRDQVGNHLRDPCA